MDRSVVPSYPYLEFVLAIGTWDWGSEAYPDTGFEGGLSIPLTLLYEIDTEYHFTSLKLADGSIRDVPAWDGLLWLDDQRFRVEVVAIGNRCLIGREVLDQLEICFSYGREVRLTFRPERRSG